MARAETLPYRTIREDRVRSFWYEGEVESDKALPEAVPGWDPATCIAVTVAADIDIDGALSDLGLDKSTPLVVGLTWSSAGTRMRGLGVRRPITSTDASTQEFTLTCEIPGEHLAESVDVSLLIALGAASNFTDPLAPSRPGARLWEQTHTVTLSGSGGRFPMQWVDFGEIALPEGAAWYLDWDPSDLHRRAGNGICLYLNSGHDRLRDALEASDPEEKDQLLFDFLRFDVGRSLIVGALLNEDLNVDRSKFEDSTLGDIVCRLIETLFHDYELSSLMQKAREDRSRMDALLQERLGLPEAF